MGDEISLVTDGECSGECIFKKSAMRTELSDAERLLRGEYRLKGEQKKRNENIRK